MCRLGGRAETSQIKNYLNVIHRITGTMRRCILVKEYTAREREGHEYMGFIYWGGCVWRWAALQLACQVTSGRCGQPGWAGADSQDRLARRVGTGWCGKSSWDCKCWARSMESGVTSGCDVRMWRQAVTSSEAAIMGWAGHYMNQE
jgi:hypothetical protein